MRTSRWFVNGDHPDDAVGEIVHDPMARKTENQYYRRLEGKVVRFYRHPDVPGTTQCSECYRLMFDHGWIDQGGDGLVVCPGDYIIENDDGIKWVLNK